jgi:hypothetical protein
MKSCGAITLRPRPECGTAIGRKPWCHCRKAFFQRAIEHVNANVEEALDGVPVRSHLLLLHPFDWQTISLTADSTKPVEIRRPARYRPGNSCPGSTHGVVIHRSARQLIFRLSPSHLMCIPFSHACSNAVGLESADSLQIRYISASTRRINQDRSFSVSLATTISAPFDLHFRQPAQFNSCWLLLCSKLIPVRASFTRLDVYGNALCFLFHVNKYHLTAGDSECTEVTTVILAAPALLSYRVCWRENRACGLHHRNPSPAPSKTEARQRVI